MKNFEETVEQYDKMIYSIIHSLHIYKQVDHYYSVGLQALWEASIKFKEEKASFTTFAYSMIRGRILTELRREAYWNSKNLNMAQHLFESLYECKYVEDYLQKEALLSYCHQLTEYQKRWVIHTFLYGRSLDEIADIYSVSKNAVKSWRRDALKKLRQTSKK